MRAPPPKVTPRSASRVIIALLLLSVAAKPAEEVVIGPASHGGGAMASVAVPAGGGRYLYSGEGGGLGVWDVQDMDNPAFAGGLRVGGYDVVDIHLHPAGQLAYLANGHDGVKVVSLTNPAEPVLLGSCGLAGSVRAVGLAGPTHLVAAVWRPGGNGFQTDGWIRVLDVSDPTHPTDIGGYDTPGTATHLSLVGHHAYEADGTNGLLVLDLRVPAAPLLLGGYNPRGDAHRVCVVGAVAYLAAGDGRLHLLNVADLAHITLLATTETDSIPRDFQVAGGLVYVVEGLTGNLHVLDVTTPNAPVRIANKKLGWNAWRIAVIGTATVHCVLGVRIDPLQSQPGLRLIWASRPGRVYDGYQSKSLLPGAWGAGRHRFAGRAAGEHLDGHHFPDAARGVFLLCRRADTVKPAV